MCFGTGDMPTNIFLILSGTFAQVDRPDPRQALSPYQLLGARKCFGDYELLHQLPHRISSVRCESPVGNTLALRKRDLAELQGAFPNLEQAWKHRAREKELQRLRYRQHMLPAECDYETFAVRKLSQACKQFISGRMSPEFRRFAVPVDMVRQLVMQQDTAQQENTEDATSVEGLMPKDSTPKELEAIVQRFDGKFELMQNSIDRLTASHESSMKRMELLQAALERFSMQALNHNAEHLNSPVLE